MLCVFYHNKKKLEEKGDDTGYIIKQWLMELQINKNL